MTLPADTVTLKVGGQEFSGWENVQVVRGVELFPSAFQLVVTERLPSAAGLFPIAPGQTCELLIGEDKVITGYVDRYEAGLAPNGHQVTISGRSITQDLVDCAAGVTAGSETSATMTFSSPTLLQLAQVLCEPFGITVTEPDGEGSPLVELARGIPQFTVPLGTTVYDILEPLAQVRQMMLLDGADGSLVLAKVGTVLAASGVGVPGNATAAAIGYDKRDRFTAYLPVAQAFDVVREISAVTGSSGNFFQIVHDDGAFSGQLRLDGKPRYRPHFVISPQIVSGISLAEQTALWEAARRWGRSQTLTAVVPLWRDAAGKLWQPNTLAQVEAPLLKLTQRNWLISQVVFQKNATQGTTTQLTLMPPEAFTPQPSFYQPFDPQISQAQGQDLQSRKPSAPAGGDAPAKVQDAGTTSSAGLG